MKTNILKSNFKFLAIIAFLALSFQSCSNDDDAMAPIISNFEFGEGHHGDDDDDDDHDHEAYAYKGDDLHLAADISSEAKVSSITLSIHAHDLTVGDDEETWDFEKVFTDAKYLAINPNFHEHIDIPSNAPAGEYHIELTVTDEDGNSTEIEGHIQILDTITIGDISIDAQVARGNDFHTEFMIDAVNGIHSISVDAHAHGLTLAEGEVQWHFEKEFLEKYHEKTSVEFHEHIDVPTTAPAGEYHIVFKVKDEKGIIKKFGTYIDITK